MFVEVVGVEFDSDGLVEVVGQCEVFFCVGSFVGVVVEEVVGVSGLIGDVDAWEASAACAGRAP